jgi:FtsH-binding integral membrane protein
VSQAPVQASQLDTALRRVRRAVLIAFAVCAAVIAAAASGGAAGAPPRGFPIAAVGLALGSVFTRQASAAARGRAQVWLALASLLLAGCIGLVGVALALQGGSRGIALAYALGGAILCLRPPAPLAPR